MKILFIAACMAVLFSGVTANAVPTAPAAASGAVTVVPFDPPLGQKLRYRSERTKVHKGSSISEWSSSDYMFEQTDDGYRLTVQLVDMGTNDARPAMVEVYRQLGNLLDAPYVVLLSEDFEVVGVEDGARYWETIFAAAEKSLLAKGVDGKPVSPQATEGIKAMMKIMREMPEDARLAKLTEGVEPLLTFGLTEWSQGKSVSSQVESASPFGGTFKRTLNITLDEVSDGAASFSLYSLVPEADLKAMIAAFFQKIPASALKPGEAGRLEEELKKMEGMKLEERSTYRVSLSDGMLLAYQFTKRTEIKGGEDSNRIETRAMRRVD